VYVNNWQFAARIKIIYGFTNNFVSRSWCNWQFALRFQILAPVMPVRNATPQEKADALAALKAEVRNAGSGSGNKPKMGRHQEVIHSSD
jgi:hypothetical protein